MPRKSRKQLHDNSLQRSCGQWSSSDAGPSRHTLLRFGTPLGAEFGRAAVIDTIREAVGSGMQTVSALGLFATPHRCSSLTLERYDLAEHVRGATLWHDTVGGVRGDQIPGKPAPGIHGNSAARATAMLCAEVVFDPTAIAWRSAGKATFGTAQYTDAPTRRRNRAL